MPARHRGGDAATDCFRRASALRRDLFQRITLGKIRKEGNRYRTPAWKGKLAREQIWAWIYSLSTSRAASRVDFPQLVSRGDATDR